MHTPLIRLPVEDVLFMRFFKPFEWASDPSAGRPSGCEPTAIAHAQMFNPRYNENIHWLIKDVSHLAISMLGRELDNSHHHHYHHQQHHHHQHHHRQQEEQQQQQFLSIPDGYHRHSHGLPAFYSPPILPSPNIHGYPSFLSKAPPPLLPPQPPPLPPTTPQPSLERSKTILRLSTTPVPPATPTFKSNYSLHRSNAILYRKNRRPSISSTISTNTSSSSRSLPTPQTSPILDMFPIAYNPIHGSRHPT
ncbi:hypothetical protein BX666DRAFT_1982119 [Dichotomocladium elegans]|nr:hypothetical protein BX666DRAFT_1982119 [Dichotomocladium elegans]